MKKSKHNIIPSAMIYQQRKLLELLDSKGGGVIKPRHINLDCITINKLKGGQVFLHCVILSVGLSLGLVNNLRQSVGLILGLIVGQCLGLDVGFSMIIEVMEGVRPLSLLNFLINPYIFITTTKATNTTEISKRKISI